MEDNTTVYSELTMQNTNPFLNNKDNMKKRNIPYTHIEFAFIVLMSFLNMIQTFLTNRQNTSGPSSSCSLNTCKWIGDGYNCYLNRTLFD